MKKTAKIVVWVLVAVLSLGSAYIGVRYYMNGRTKHGLVFLPAVPALLVIGGLVVTRSPAKRPGDKS